jgi:hypothetical protein
MPKSVAVLFARKDSIYKKMPECDVWDQVRDATKYAGNLPVVAHPPCRLWGKLAHMSTAPKSEMELARFSVRQVQRVGGVLEHPEGSRLWKEMGLPQQWEEDSLGFTLKVPQSWWRHRAAKMTLLYVSGMRMEDIPRVPLIQIIFNQPTALIATSRRGLSGKFCTQEEREATPEEFAQWLVAVAKICRKIK